MGEEALKISVVIPVYNEASTLPEIFSRLNIFGIHEVVFVNGDSRDETHRLLQTWSDGQEDFALRKVLLTPRGRGVQMNAGAGAATGEVLLFLHADTVLPSGWVDLVQTCMEDPKVVGGAFSLQIDSPHFFLSWVTQLANFRSMYLKLPYGDQAFFVRREVFYKIGAYRPIPLMEDVEFIRRLKKAGDVCILPEPVLTSARRWEKQGHYFTSLRNMVLLVLYFLGVSPQRLAKWYDT